jgi:hypothetical protein
MIAFTVVAGIVLGLAYSFLMLGFFEHSAIYDSHKYRYANEWTGLNFLLSLPLILVFFVPLFIFVSVTLSRNWLGSVGMMLGILVAGSACLVFLHFFHPADYSLPNQSADVLILSWGLLSVGCAWVGHVVCLNTGKGHVARWRQTGRDVLATATVQTPAALGRRIDPASEAPIKQEGIIRVAVIGIAVSLIIIAGLMVLQVVQHYQKEAAETAAAHDWIYASNGSVPPGAMAGGYEASPGRETLFICRAPVSGGIYPGKVRQGFGSCRIAFAGAAMGVATYQVLTTVESSWVAAQGGVIPANAYEAGKASPPNDEKFYICRTSYNGGVHPGRLEPKKGCNIEWGGKEIFGDTYEVLVRELQK